MEGAFLRGDDLRRAQGRVFMQQPPGGLEGVEEGAILEAVKAVYGLADAPLAWYQLFTKTLLGLGCRQSKFGEFQKSIYYAYSKQQPKELNAVIALHVDDMCLGGNAEFVEPVVKPLKEKYPFKHWHEKRGKFLGKWVEQLESGDIAIQQTKYPKSLKGIELRQERKREKRDRNAETNEEEKRQKRQNVKPFGAINCLDEPWAC